MAIRERLSGNEKYMRLTVSDNGTSKKPAAAGLGLNGMRERARAAGGTFSVKTESGFTLTTVLPKG